MRLSRIAIMWLLVVLLTVAFAGSSYASLYRITALNDPTNQYGWQTHSLRCWAGKGGMLSAYNGGARGNAGPAPGYNLGFECTESSPPDNGSPSQTWVGTNRYVGTKLTDIKKINYWAIVDWRGPNTSALLDGNDNAIYHEWRLQSMSSQPPAILLTISINQGADTRTMLYRPWSSTVLGFGPSAVEFNATGTARLHRIWQEYTAVDVAEGNFEGVWYITESIDAEHPTGMYTWLEILDKYWDAELVTPTVVQNPVFMSDPVQAPIPCSFNLHMGALANGNNDWASVGKDNWWFESYWARGCADLVTFAYDADPSEEGENIVEESFDFDVPVAGAYPERLVALNNAGVYDQNAYMPNPRTRKSVKPTEPISWGEGTVVLANLNAPQRYGHFGTSFLRANGATVPGSTKINLFVLYGKICDDPPILTGADLGKWFYVDDGSGKKVKCYCPGSYYSADISEGNYVRMVGNLQGHNPYEWYWNEFHYIQWKEGFPEGCAMSQPHPWEFQTYPWNVTVLNWAPAM